MKKNKKTAGSSITKSALERLYIIDQQIASEIYPNSGDLAEKCEISIATISRDIEFMRDRLFAPVEYDPFKRGYFYTEKPYRIPGVFASAENLIALGMAKTIFSLYRETPLYEASKNLLENIITPIASDGNRDWLENRIAVPKIASAKVNQDIWETVIEGLKRNKIITFNYKGTWDEEYQKRRVHPYQLLFDSGVWYLYGFAEERKDTRIFSLSRMGNIALTKDSFTLPKNFSYEDFAGGSYFGIFIGQKKIRFAIECYDEAVYLSSERQWAADQKITVKENGVTFEFSSTQYEKVLKWVLSCGCTAVPKKPQKLVDDWKWHIQEMRKLAAK